jgi:hypothetical protein
MHVDRTLVLTGSLLITAIGIGSAHANHAGAVKKAAGQYITCPITHDRVLKSKAIKVTAANGKSTYVCCSDCIAAAKKKLMAKK